MRSQPKHHSGFTLTDMLVAVTLITAIVAVIGSAHI
jgi:type II secretory pathway component PulJ